MLMSLSNANLSQSMQQMVTMLRNRYILEFPRRDIEKAGKIALSVSIDGLNAFIRPAGDGVPVAPKSQGAPSAAIQSEIPSKQAESTSPPIEPAQRP